jgi:hypothetical protein
MRVSYKGFTSKRPFGVEAEFSWLGIMQDEIANIINVCDPFTGVEIAEYGFSDGECWQVKTDSTCGWEVASYKGSGIYDLSNIGMCIEAVGDLGGVIDNTCGFHVHVDVSDFSEEEIAKTIAYWIKIESVVLNSVPLHRAKNKYCKPLRRMFSMKKLSSCSDARDFYCKVKPPHLGNRYRRVTLNICNYVRSCEEKDFARKTLELRLPEATVRAYDIKNWVKFFILFIENTKEMPMPKSCDMVDINETMCILGLHRNEGALILSNALFSTKEWFLSRVMKRSRSKKLSRGAINMLNNMWFPLRKYHLDKRCEVFTKKSREG